MKSWILSSSVLILAVVGLRWIFRKKLSLNLRYSLWLLVLLRLLLPLHLGQTALSVQNILPETRPAVTAPMPGEPAELRGKIHSQKPLRSSSAPTALPEKSFSLEEILTGMWLAGMAVTGGFFVLTNSHFYRRLRSGRRRLRIRADLPVYVTDRIESPCLFGLLHPAIYVTGEAAEDPVLLRHTLAHETCHFHHGDNFWAVLRGVCLTFHWYNPLVWWAAWLSQRDGELACDEAAVRLLGEENRAEYGRTLIRMTCQKKQNLLTAATTMTADHSALKERIQTLVQRPRTVAFALAAVALAGAVCVGCTFTGPKPEEKPVLTGDPIFEKGNVEHLELIREGETAVFTGDTLERSDAQRWAWEFRYGERIPEPEQPDPVALCVVYEDQVRVMSGLDTITVNGDTYAVNRPDMPESLQKYLEQAPEQFPAPTAEQISLTVADRPQGISLGLTLTGKSWEFGDYDYLVPQDTEKFEKAYEAAVSEARDSEDFWFGPWVLLKGQESWYFNENGEMSDGHRVVTGEAAKALYQLCLAELADAGIPQPVDPRELKGVTGATLHWLSQDLVLRDPEQLSQLEQMLSGSREITAPSCWFTATLEVETEDGSFHTIAMATDSCRTWMSNGRYYTYGSGDNSSFYGLFLDQALHDGMELNIPDLEILESYLDYDRYGQKFGREEAQALRRRLEGPMSTLTQAQKDAGIQVYELKAWGEGKATNLDEPEKTDPIPMEDRAEFYFGQDPDVRLTLTENTWYEVPEGGTLTLHLELAVHSPFDNDTDLGICNLETGLCYGYSMYLDSLNPREGVTDCSFPDLPEGRYRVYGFNRSGRKLETGILVYTVSIN